MPNLATAGPGMAYSDALRQEAELDTSFRFIIAHAPAVDGNFLRLDVLLNAKQGPEGFPVSGDQYHVTLQCSGPGDSHLWMPPLSHGVRSGITFKVNKSDLCQELRALANSIEANEGVNNA